MVEVPLMQRTSKLCIQTGKRMTLEWKSISTDQDSENEKKDFS